MQKSKTVASYISQSKTWSKELRALRAVLKDTPLVETIKWGAPCYTYRGKNIVGMASFTDYFGLWFHQGATLKDTNKKLINAQEGKTRALRQWRMNNLRDIKPTIIKRYIKESIKNIEDGVEIKPVRKRVVNTPKELKKALEETASLRTAYNALTPGKQREYAQYINEAKQAATKQRRLAKIIPMILAGGGLNDRYR